MEKNLQRKTLIKLQKTNNNPLIPLRLEYSKKSKLLTGYIEPLINIDRIYPTHLPTQASYRWSTQNPPITNWPRECINVECVDREHEWTDHCFSIRDILLPDEDEVMIVWDHDNIEGRIHDIIVGDTANIEAHNEGYDLHTITCCDIFSMDYPQDRIDPHSSEIDRKWREKYNWQGKDTRQRVLAKNFNHGSKYTKTYKFVHRIPGIEEYGVTMKHMEELGKQYIEAKGIIWHRKLKIMEMIQRKRIARTLQGARRLFFDSSEDTAKEGFSHMISGTASLYNDETIILLEERFGPAIRILHNAHDGDKMALKKTALHDDIKEELSEIIERTIEYQGRKVKLSAGIKIYGHA